ncbi:MAG TPA: pro-sigmaK processing inhibitor BofA family protein [Candidatus Enterenecus merdae]|nr:pro-sigmaK processing inhibitor BofA family protein [Candidatus Enterenecus merdae]
MSGWVWAGAAAALVVLVLARRPLAALGRLLGRSGVGLAFLWAFQSLGSWLGTQLGVNLFNALVLGVLGLPGFALLLMTQWLVG